MIRWSSEEAAVATAIPSQGEACGPEQFARVGSVLATLERDSGLGAGTLVRAILELVQHQRTRAGAAGLSRELAYLFEHFIGASDGRACLHLTADGRDPPALGPNWVVIDLRRCRYMRECLLSLEDNCMDLLFCSGLERMPHPARVAAAMRRVLKPLGQVWLEAAFNEPGSAVAAGATSDYWRISPDGLRCLMRGFDEIFCCECPTGRWLQTTSFFYGLKAGTRIESMNGS